MAKLNYVISTWIAASEAQYLLPGQSMHWWWWNFFDFGDILNATAHPTLPNNPPPGMDEPTLSIEKINVSVNPSARIVDFLVTNTGSSPVIGYVFGFSVVSP